MKHLHHPFILVLIVAGWLWAAHLASQPPLPQAGVADTGQWSLSRADEILAELLAENKPHPSGSRINSLIRDRIIERLRSWEYPVETQTGWHCNPGYGSCSTVSNIVAVHRGREGRNAVLLTAHYDSGLAGAGAADDGAGVAAVLEVARLLTESPPLENDVIILLTDGEERGLVGAHYFAAEHPLFARVKAVVNLEARGVTGASAMFETGPGNRRMIREFSDAVEKPVANSLTYEIYRRMPNDTDYSVYRDLGVMGINFAFSGGVAAYHSTRDDLINLDRGSMQHHGDNAWAMVRNLGDYNLDRITAEEDAAYVDFLGLVLWHYPVSIAGGVAVFLTVLILLGTLVWSRGQLKFGVLFWSVIALVLAIAALLLGSWLISWPLGRWVDMHPLEHPSPWVGRAVLYLLAVLAVWLGMKLTRERKSPAAMTLAAWLIWCGAGLWTSYNLPAASYIFLLPMFAFFCGMLIDVWRPGRQPAMLFARLLGFIMAAYMAVYHFQMLDVVLNFQFSHIKVIPLVLLVVAALPVVIPDRDQMGGWGQARLLLGLIVAGCLAQHFVPAFSADRPREMALMYLESKGSNNGHLIVESLFGPVDEDFVAAHDFKSTALPRADGELREVPARAQSALGLPAAQLSYSSIEEVDGLWWHTFDLVPPPGAEDIRILPGNTDNVREIRVDGELAWDGARVRKSFTSAITINLAFPGESMRRIVVVSDNADPLEATTRTRLPIPGSLLAPYENLWPEDAQPAFLGSRAEVSAGISGTPP